MTEELDLARGRFDRTPGDPSHCVHCGHAERDHTWRCDGCGEALYWPPWQHFPALHVSAFPQVHPLWSGAALCCAARSAR